MFKPEIQGIFEEVKEPNSAAAATSTFANNNHNVLLGEEEMESSASKSSPTFFTEVEAIDLVLKIIDLLELLHENNMVHTNLAPSEIFLKDKKLNQMQFLNLFYCTSDSFQEIGFKHIVQDESISALDMRLRHADYISPEQI